MANITPAIGELVTGDTTAQKVTVSGITTADNVTFFIKLRSGTGIKIGVDSIPATADTFLTTDTIPPVTCQNGRLYVKTSTNTDTFSISVA